MEEYVVEVVNLTQGKLYYLSKPHFDRVAACAYGQDYVRDHRQENKDLIYFRVVVKSTVKSFTPVNFNIDWYDGEEYSCSPIEETPCPEDQDNCFQCPKFSQCWEEEEQEKETEYCNGDCFACPDTAKCEAYCSLNRGDCSTCSKLGDCDNIDPSYLARDPKYFEGLLVQKMIEGMNKSFNSNSVV